MKSVNAEFLEQHKQIYEVFMRNQTITAMTSEIRDNYVRILKEEFQPAYSVDMWCGHCVARMVKDLYGFYYQWKKTNESINSDITL